MNYDEAVKYIKDTAAFGSKLGLDNIRTLMSLLGDPQEKLRCIHIAGTNGKGSVAAYMLSVLVKAGYRTGFYTSPELMRFSERIRINEEEISEADIACYATKVRDKAEYMRPHAMGDPTEFELVLAMAFCYFLDNKVDAVILEVGLGGRLDATNVISSSLLSVITKISFDHMQYLGNTLREIAYEKASIIKPGGRVIVYPGNKDVMTVYEEMCRDKGASLFTAVLPSERRALSPALASDKTGQQFILKGESYTTKMAGTYEADNAALAIQALKLLPFDMTEDFIHEGINDAVWPGRFEILSKTPLIIADGAHNEDGARALAATLKEYFGDGKVTLCLGILRDKEYEKMLRLLLPLSDRVIVCEVPNPRTLKAEELARIIRQETEEPELIIAHTPGEAFEEIKKLQYDTAAIICGSLYLAGPMRELITSP